MRIRQYYHAWAAGAWERPAREHVEALARWGLAAPMVIGLAGPPDARYEARVTISRWLRDEGLPGPQRWAEADEGWEQVTLKEIRADVHAIPGEWAALYCHTKGAHDNTPLNARWRQAMTAQVVGEWPTCVALLADNETAGCHRVTNREGVTFYGGNFWWARASYLRTLGPPPNDTRWQAETWVQPEGDGHADLLPGFPEYGP